ncbi:3-hydroxyisobutyrate dehydrogenase [Neisseria animalis]|uniref:3-hydroxyisobutyrate dehydrogenase n=2 Tax=Neisseria animalis TaxID=492 RepID=A0A5P3MPL8_NEIAN|nr:3-hydroxyisobutyrate dehydrogenase [Neisseria animalis]QEY23483.1 3-hydroxyisobutyrate dehydrogenase [Neisseria animalis]ROW33330.1 3-hydroxyisobutyrate dehydrogenase [Neisseria animalis]VEE09045.1 3-hydroxyacid dehydrogenase [Neisseria animalis]
MSIQNILFVGLGNMGAPMAANLLKKGYALQVSDLNPDAVSALTKQGALYAADLTQAAAQADAVITMLPAGKHVKSVYLGENGLFGRLKPDTLVIDCSTIAADDARELAAEAQAHRLRFLEAPVSGGISGAAAGTLSFMIGGSGADFQTAKPLLESMGKNIFHAGGSGAGQTAKICNNMLLSILMTGTAEALALGIKNGLDPKVLSGIMAASSGGNWVLDRYNPYPGVIPESPASKGYRNGFMSALMLKDLDLALDNARTVGLAAPMGENARALYLNMKARGLLDSDFSAVMKLYTDIVK